VVKCVSQKLSSICKCKRFPATVTQRSVPWRGRSPAKRKAALCGVDSSASSSRTWVGRRRRPASVGEVAVGGVAKGQRNARAWHARANQIGKRAAVEQFSSNPATTSSSRAHPSFDKAQDAANATPPSPNSLHHWTLAASNIGLQMSAPSMQLSASPHRPLPGPPLLGPRLSASHQNAGLRRNGPAFKAFSHHCLGVEKKDPPPVQSLQEIHVFR
jgi:hypothetical protein